MTKIEFYSDGAAEEVTGSKHYLTINDKKILLDCGLWQGNEETVRKNSEYTFPDDIYDVINSHAHADHCALLPLLIKQGYKGKIHSTPATRDLGSIIMLDSAKIQSYEGIPIYTEQDCINTMNHYRCSVYEKEKKISDDIKYTFYDAGHILGSAMVDISVPKYTTFFEKIIHKKEDNRKHILFTGDLGRESNPICYPPATNMPAPEYIIMESTYGNKTHESLETVYQELAYMINRTIERGGKVIIPSFAIERAQELIYFIKVLMREDKIPKIPVWIDSPMAANATGIFNVHPECLNDDIKEKFISKGKNPFSVRTLKFINNYKESLKIAKSDKPCIVISCNGMCEAGRILNHLQYGISNKNNTILFVGYQAQGTLGRSILEKTEKITINKKEYEVKAEIHKINSFSAHADYKEITDWLSKIDTSKLKKIFLVHGEKDAQAFLKQHLEQQNYKVEIVKKNEVYKLK